MSQGAQHLRIRFFSMACFALLGLPVQAQPLSLTVDDLSGGIFAGALTHTAVTLSGERHSYARILWQLSARGRVLVHGERDVVFDGEETITLTLPIAPPPLRPGLSLRATLAIDGVAAADALPTRLYATDVVLYGPDVLRAERDHFATMHIQLFDLIGRTAEIFDQLNIPYHRLSRDKLNSVVPHGLLAIGAGVRLDQSPTLSHLLLEHARKGGRVLLLQPASGALALEEMAGDAMPRAAAWWFSDAPSFATMDGGDVRFLQQGGQRLRLREQRGVLSLLVVGQAEGNWSWTGLSFKETQGSLVVCTLPLSESVDNHPVAQLMLGKLLTLASAFPSNLYNTNKGSK
jgi:hypothetical protein